MPDYPTATPRALEWRGHIINIDKDGSAFTFKPLYGEAFVLAAPERLRTDIAAAHHRYETSQSIGWVYRDDALYLLTGMLTGADKRQDGEPVSLDRAELTPLPSADVIARIDTMRHMKDNWFEPGDKAPSASGLDWIFDAYRRHYPKDAPKPFISPMGDGRVNLDWEYDAISVEAEIDIDAHIAETMLYGHQTSSAGIEDNAILDMNRTEAWRYLAKIAADARSCAAQPDGAKPTPAPPPLDIRANASVTFCDITAGHPAIGERTAQFKLASDYRPAGEKAQPNEPPARALIVAGDEFAPFAQASIKAPFTTAREHGKWIAHFVGTPADAAFAALKERVNKPVLLYAESPAGQRLYGAFNVDNAAAITPRAFLAAERAITLTQLSPMTPGWY